VYNPAKITILEPIAVESFKLSPNTIIAKADPKTN
jgi:hypothetical protein